MKLLFELWHLLTCTPACKRGQTLTYLWPHATHPLSLAFHLRYSAIISVTFSTCGRTVPVLALLSHHGYCIYL